MIRGGALLWLLCMTGQLVYMLKRADFAVHGPDRTILSFRAYFERYFAVLIFRAAIGLLIFSLWAFHADALWTLITTLGTLFGITVGEKWHVLWSIPVIPPTAFLFGLGVDFGLDWIAPKIPFLKSRMPSLQFYQQIQQLQAQQPAQADSTSAGQKGYMKLHTLLLAALLSTALLILTACPDSQLHQAAQVANGIASSLNNAESLNESAYHQGIITAADSAAVSNYIKYSVQVNEQLIAQVRSVKKVDPQSAATILAAIDNLAASIDVLQNQGVLHIKDPNTQKQFGNYIAIIRAAIQSARQIIGSSSVTKPTSSSIRRPTMFALYERSWQVA